MAKAGASYSGERVLITGAGGFIGSHLAKRLASNGAKVLALTHGKGATPSRLKGIKAQVKPADITDRQEIMKIISTFKPQYVFHLAAFTSVARDPKLADKMTKTNVIGTINLMDACIKAGNVKAFVNTGTCEEYGNSPVPFTEDMTPRPPSPYAASKATATVFCQTYYVTFGFPSLTVRPFFTYGPGQEEDRFLPALIKATIAGKTFKMTGGKQTREYNYIDDIVDGYLLAGKSRKAIGQIINLGNSKEISVLALAKKVIALVGSGKLAVGALPYRENEVWRLFCSNKKATQLLGWKPKTSLEVGLKKTIESYRYANTKGRTK